MWRKPMQRKSLVVYLPDLSTGGVERVHINLAPAFIEAGFDVTFLLHRNVGELASFIPPGVRVITFGCNRTLKSLFPLMRFLRQESPDILLSNLGHNNIIAIWAAMLAKVPTRVIVSWHNTLSAESRANTNWQYRILPWLCRRFLNKADGIVAVSKGVADDLTSVTGIMRDRITVIYNPIVTREFDVLSHEVARHPWLADGAPSFLLGVGRLSAQKDFALLISAFTSVAQTRNIRLILLGEGPLRANFMAQAQTLGVADRLSMPGFLPNPLPFMRKAAALVMSSRYEGFGNVLAEALACGTAVVSTDCPHGPAEVLEDGKYGILVPVGNIEAMAKALTQVLEHPPEKKNLLARGQEFTAERAAGLYISLFNSVSLSPCL